ncbi:MAG: hypothetical protein L6V81_04005 [Clostridium sp.]|nr:MAG: hypothetical protein L6V81_04005 [Clostridium sp.]
MSEDEYYKGWCTREEDNAFMDYQTGLENGKEEGLEEGTISIAKKRYLKKKRILKT